MGPEEGNVLAFEHHPAFCRNIDPANHIEKGRLPGTIGADQSSNLSLVDGKIQIANRLQTAKIHAYVIYLK
jgi:hypothetical protein